MRDEQPSLEQLFEAARRGERAPNAERDRLLGAVGARLTQAGVMSTSIVLTAKASASLLGAPAKAVAALGTHKFAALLVIVALGVTGAVLVARRSPAQHPSTAVAAAALTPVSLPVNSVTQDKPTAPAAASAPETGSSTPVAVRPLPSTNRGERSSLADELAAVRSAQGALAAGQPTRALTALDWYFRRFPNGVLLPEAKATQIRALCQAGLSEQANRLALRFEAEHSDSPLAARHKLRCYVAGE